MEEDPLYEEVASRKAQRRQERAALYEVEAQPYAPMEDEALDAGAKRGVTDQILKNRGLTAYKNKLNRNPRVKKREAYRKAVIRRKGQVRDVRESEAQGYGGEATGINLKVVRKRGTGK
jgi:U3 small nucleolar RNA-associated protein 3